MNPILQKLNQNSPANSIMGTIQMLKNKDPGALYSQMMNTNPQFRSFVESNRGKSVDQIAQDYGVDMDAFRSLLKR